MRLVRVVGTWVTPSDGYPAHPGEGVINVNSIVQVHERDDGLYGLILTDGRRLYVTRHELKTVLRAAGTALPARRSRG